mgnify:CR=1 FL=1
MLLCCVWMCTACALGIDDLFRLQVPAHSCERHKKDGWIQLLDGHDSARRQGASPKEKKTQTNRVGCHFTPSCCPRKAAKCGHWNAKNSTTTQQHTHNHHAACLTCVVCCRCDLCALLWLLLLCCCCGLLLWLWLFFRVSEPRDSKAPPTLRPVRESPHPHTVRPLPTRLASPRCGTARTVSERRGPRRRRHGEARAFGTQGRWRHCFKKQTARSPTSLGV